MTSDVISVVFHASCGFSHKNHMWWRLCMYIIFLAYNWPFSITNTIYFSIALEKYFLNSWSPIFLCIYLCKVGFQPIPWWRARREWRPRTALSSARSSLSDLREIIESAGNWGIVTFHCKFLLPLWLLLNLLFYQWTFICS